MGASCSLTDVRNERQEREQEQRERQGKKENGEIERERTNSAGEIDTSIKTESSFQSAEWPRRLYFLSPVIRGWYDCISAARKQGTSFHNSTCHPFL